MEVLILLAALALLLGPVMFGRAAFARREGIRARIDMLLDGLDRCMVWQVDPASARALFASRTAETMTGHPLSRWLAEPDFLLRNLHPDDRERVLSAVRRAHATGGAERIEHRFFKANGDVLWLDTALSGAWRNGRRSSAVRCVSLAMQRADAAELALRKREERERMMTECISSLVSSSDPAEVFRGASRCVVPTFADVCIVDLFDDDGSIHRMTSPAGCGVDGKQMTAPQENERRSTEQVAVLLEADVERELAPTSMFVLPLAAERSTVGAIAFVRRSSTHDAGASETEAQSLEPFDPSDRSLGEQYACWLAYALENARRLGRTKEALRARDEFLSIASHELKNPLCVLTLQMQLLSRAIETAGALPVERVREHVRGASVQLGRLAKMTDCLLDLSRATSGQLALSVEQVDLSRLVADVAGRFRAEAKGAIRVDTEAGICGEWDRMRLEQVVTNLLSNAVKYGADNPIDVSLTSTCRAVVLSVRDRGIGIAPSRRQRIFERFERCVSSAQFVGLGLGLYIARQIVDAHGGEIQVESALGVGSTFKVILPRGHAPDPQAPPA